MIVKQWQYSDRKTAFAELKNAPRGFGFVYAARIDVVQGFTLLKIGATQSPYFRMSNFGDKASLFCVSPPCTNFWENEDILHQFFAAYRVPRRPHQGAQAELFNLSMPYFLSHLPQLHYAQERK